MGFFSFKTCDKEESIYNMYTDRCRKVYMLQPDGKPPIEEPEYQGYGMFGGVDCYVLLAMMNFSEDDLKEMSDDEVRTIGINLDVGRRMSDSSGNVYICGLHSTNNVSSLLDKGANIVRFSNYGSVIDIDGLSKTVNDHRNDGRIVEEKYKYAFPLKFSFDKSAVYEKLPASKNCENQGYFG